MLDLVSAALFAMMGGFCLSSCGERSCTNADDKKTPNVPPPKLYKPSTALM